MLAIINGKIITEKEVVENKVIVFNDKIVAITDETPKNCTIIDAKGMYISPGLIDVHVHGSCGADTMDQSVEAIQTISEGIAKKGVTSFLPTTMTMEKEAIYHALDIVRDCMDMTFDGAKVVGAHMEGPFINANYKGAQPEQHIIKPSFEFIQEYTDVLKIVSYAPEQDENLEFTKTVKSQTDITLSIGHTNATFDQAMDAIEAGASHITHTFNAMTPLNHREPGVVGAAMISDVYTEVIADTIHINKKLFQFVVNNKGTDKIVLITDSMKAGCMKDGKYDLGGQDVYVENGAARLENGTLAGSVLTLNKAVLNFWKNTKTSISEAIHMASLNPAKTIGINDAKGSIAIGKDADLVIFDESLDCYLTISEGRIIYSNL